MLDGSTGIGLFNGGGGSQLSIQAIGVAAYGAWAVITSLIVLYVLKATIGLRVSEEDEKAGLDVSEHDEAAFGSDMLP
jgi:Amt family ammonium transporter